MALSCVDIGHAYLSKRGDAGINTDFDSGATTVYIAARVTDYVTASVSGFGNILALNIEKGDTGTQSGFVQVYYDMTTDQIRWFTGEGFDTQDNLIRSGASTQWARFAVTCAGGLSDPVKLHWIFEDETAVTTVTVSAVGGNANKGGSLRQVLFGGMNITDDERGYNVRIAQGGIFKVEMSAAQVLAQRVSQTPTLTGSSLMSWYDWSTNTDPANDVGATYGAAGTFDFTGFDGGEATNSSDYPGKWGIAGTCSATLGALSVSGYGGVPMTRNIGSSTISFGTTPTDRATIRVNNQPGITGTAKCEAWLMADSTASHNADEHILMGCFPSSRPRCSSVAANDGFDVTIQSNSKWTGDFKVRWVWVN